MTKTAQFKLGDYVERVRNLHDNYLSVPIGTRFTITKVCDYYAWGDNMFIGINDIELVSERDALVEIVEKALARRAKARKKYLAAGEAVALAEESLAEYDEDHRKPTFSDCVVAMGVGAVLRNRESGTTYVKAGPGAWTNGLVGSLVTAEATYFKDAHHWIVLTEGIDE